MAMQFSPKILGLNVGNLRTVFGQSGVKFRDFFQTVRDWIFGLFLGSPRLIFKLYWMCVLFFFFFFVAGKMNNMLICAYMMY